MATHDNAKKRLETERVEASADRPDTPQAAGGLFSSAALPALFENSFDAILVFTSEGQVRLANQSALDLFGYNSDVIAGMRIEFLLPVMETIKSGSTFAGVYVPEKLASIPGEDLIGRRADGSRFKANIRVVPDRSGQGDQRFVCHVREAAVAQWGKTELTEIARRYQDFLQSAGDRFWETDDNHHYVFLSDPVKRLTKPIKDVLGLTPWENFHGQLAGDELDQLMAYFLNRRPFREFKITWELNGSHCHVVLTGKPFYDADGVFKGFRGTSRDATDEFTAAERATQAE